MTNEYPSIKVGSRKSELALIQTRYVIGRLQNIYPNQKFEIHTMSTIGDRVLNVSLPKIGEKSLFTRDLEDALRNGGVDFVVHSLKDLPTTLPTGMAIGAVLEREDARDALVLRAEYEGHTIDTLPKGSVIGTSSLRRTAQIRRQYPHLVVCDIRGNLNTRLAKLDAPGSKFAGIILAQAGLVRMGWMNRISQVLDPLHLLYAVGQGALAVECRSNDVKILSMLEKLMCLPTSCRILAERSFLKTLGGGCSAPVAVWSTLKGSISDCNSNSVPNLRLTGAVWSLDGSTEIREEQLCPLKIRDNDESVLHDNKSDIIDEPPMKRRREISTENLLDNPKDLSPPVINDDVTDDISNSYDIDELIEKHAQLVKKCPFLGGQTDLNGNSKVGGGDADQTLSCPLHVEIGQDVMGQCPFVNNEAKIMTRKHNPPHLPAKPTNESTDVFNTVNDCTPPTTSKSPFTSVHQNIGDPSTVKAHEKCPFLQKAVKMFDYADEEKPQSMNIPTLIEDVDNLFCGLFRHACHERDLYVRCNKLGQQLAEELIKRGALDIMKTAQAEIHGKT